MGWRPVGVLRLFGYLAYLAFAGYAWAGASGRLTDLGELAGVCVAPQHAGIADRRICVLENVCILDLDLYDQSIFRREYSLTCAEVQVLIKRANRNFFGIFASQPVKGPAASEFGLYHGAASSSARHPSASANINGIALCVIPDQEADVGVFRDRKCREMNSHQFQIGDSTGLSTLLRKTGRQPGSFRTLLGCIGTSQSNPGLPNGDPQSSLHINALAINRDQSADGGQSVNNGGPGRYSFGKCFTGIVLCLLGFVSAGAIGSRRRLRWSHVGGIAFCACSLIVGILLMDGLV